MGEMFIWMLALVMLIYSGYLLIKNMGNAAVAVDAIVANELDHIDVAPKNDGSKRSLRASLDTLDIRIQPLTLFFGSLSCSAAVFFSFDSLFPERTILSLVAGLSFIPIAVMVIRDLGAWQARRFERALVDVVDLMVSAAAGGTSPINSLKLAGTASRGFVRVAIEDVVNRISLGASIDAATSPLIRKYPAEGVQLFAKTLASRWYGGGDFEGLLSALGRILRDRNSYQQQLNSQLTGARYAVIFAAFFPYVLIPFFLWKEPGWLEPLTAHPMGPSLMFAALMGQILGFLIMRKILRSEL